jgi:hypothetical protein
MGGYGSGRGPFKVVHKDLRGGTYYVTFNTLRRTVQIHNRNSDIFYMGFIVRKITNTNYDFLGIVVELDFIYATSRLL